MKSKILIIVLIGLVVAAGGLLFLVFGGSISSLNEDSNSSVQEQRRIPDLTFQDYEGNNVALLDFAGKPVVVNSWATWCPFCVDELPDFAAVQEEFKDEVVFIAIDRAESLTQAKKFSDNLGITEKMIFLLDPRDDFYKAISGFSMPETIFVDREGIIRDHKRGPMTAEEIRRRLQSIL